MAEEKEERDFAVHRTKEALKGEKSRLLSG